MIKHSNNINQKPILRLGNIQQKVILLLFSGLALGFSMTPKQSHKIIRATAKEWKKLNNQQIKRSVASLKNFGIIKIEKRSDGTMKIVLTKKGKKIAGLYRLDSLKIRKPERWDKKWRVVIFDVPEDKRRLRDIFRHRLKKLGFYELQHSVWIHPYNCIGEIEYLIDFYKVSSYVHLLEATTLSNDGLFKNMFSLK